MTKALTAFCFCGSLDVERFKKELSITKDKFFRINDRIRFSPVIIIDEDGENLGEMPTYKARALAQEKGLDLVEINPTSRPPICKIMDYGKFKYDLAKKEKKNRLTQKETGLKEIRLTPKIGDHDIDYKAKQAREFFDRGNKVKVSMRLRGREHAFIDNALRVFDKFLKHTALSFERPPVKLGSQITAMLDKAKEDDSAKSANASHEAGSRLDQK